MSESRRRLLRRLGLPFWDGSSPAAVSAVSTARAVPSRSVPVDTPPMLALIATRNHLPFADLASRSFLAHHPDFRAFLLLVDGTEADRHSLEDVSVVLLSDLDLPDAAWLATKLNATELSNALKPVFLTHLAAYGRRAIYLDCDIAVFARFHALINALGARDLVLIPHMMSLFPRPDQPWLHPNNADVFNSGLINAGCFGIDLARAGTFLEFWQNANLLHAWASGPGRQTDQQFLNWALIQCENIHVLRDTTYNVAYWNLHERSFRHSQVINGEPSFQVDGRPLTFFHFSGFDPADTLRLSRHDQRYSVYTLPSVALILEWYSAHLLTGAHSSLIQSPYGFDTLGNDVQIGPFIRDIFKRYNAYIPRYDTRTADGADALCAFLMAPLPATGSRLPLIAAVIYESRTDLQRDYPGAHVDLHPTGFWRWFCTHGGVEYKIEPLIERFRHVIESDSLAGFAIEVERLLQPNVAGLQFLGTHRRVAADELRSIGRPDLAASLLACETEWFFFSPFSAVLTTYAGRPDLQEAFPDPFGRSHAEFAIWLSNHGTSELGLPAEVVTTFLQKSAQQTLARLFSLLSRREELGAIAVDEMLSEHPERLIRALICDAGEGLEYDLADVEVFCFLHRHFRRFLIPLYLELPAIRRLSPSSRTPEGRRALLPLPHDSDWVFAGCRLHEANFSPAEVALDEEIRQLRLRIQTTGRDVISVLHAARLTMDAGQLARIAEQRAVRHLSARNDDPRNVPAPRSLQPAINLFGYFHAGTGVGESSRGLSRALSYLSDVRQVPQFTSHLKPGTQLSDLFTHYNHHAYCNVFVSYPHANDDPFGCLPAEFTERRRNVVHLAWEQRDWNVHWRSVYGRYDEVWTMSDFSAQAFRDMFGPDKVRVVPNVLLVDEFPSGEQEAAARFNQPIFRFLFVFDANSSIERKNPEAVLAAFMAAFSGTGRAGQVELVLKVNNLDRAEHSARIVALREMAARSGLSISFDGRHLERSDVLKLIASADCYVSLHRAEGFGYTMAEAMYYGVPVIASGYSGNLEYMTQDNSYLVPCTETLVQNADGPFQRGSVWGEPNIAVAADMMRAVVEDRAMARRVGERAAASVRLKLLPEIVAETLRPAINPASTPARRAGW